jgi:hypothetical protein
MAGGWRLSRLHAQLLWSTRAELTEFATPRSETIMPATAPATSGDAD